MQGKGDCENELHPPQLGITRARLGSKDARKAGNLRREKAQWRVSPGPMAKLPK